MRCRRRALATSACALALAGCSAAGVDSAELEDSVLADFSTDGAPDPMTSVECDGGLAAEIAATQICRAEFESGLLQELELQVQDVSDARTDFDVRAVDSVLSGDGVARLAEQTFARQGVALADVSCEDVEAVNGAEGECTATVDGTPGVVFSATMSRVAIASGDINMDFEIP